MSTDRFKNALKEIFSFGDIKIDGDRSWDIQVHNDKFYQRILTDGSLGFGESYMDGWWDCEKLDELVFRIFSNDIDKKHKMNWRTFLKILMPRIINMQSKKRVFQVADKHFNLGNNLFKAMLDKRMVYTCAYWKNAKNLDEAQEAKLDLVCKKTNLKPGQTVLELGCGWGGFAKYAAEKYGVKVLGINVSKEQVELGNKLCKGLPVELRLQDYREAQGKFDRVISIGLLEHVGYKNYRTYMETADRCLKDDGIAFIQAIGGNASQTKFEPWSEKYIFPNAMTPSISQIGKAMEGLFVMEDWHNFGPDYDKTLMVWHNNFENAWPELKKNYDERFRRMWRFYLLTYAGTFRSRRTQAWQIVMTKPGTRQPACRVS